MTSFASQHLWKLRSFFCVMLLALVSYHPTIQRYALDSCLSVFERETKTTLSFSNAIFHLLPGIIIFDDLVIKKQIDETPVLIAKRSSIDFAPVQSILCLKFIFELSVVGVRVPIYRGINALLDLADVLKSVLETKSKFVGLSSIKLSSFSFGEIGGGISIQTVGGAPIDTESDISVDSGSLRFPPDLSALHPARIGKVIINIPSVAGDRKLIGEIIGRADKSFLMLKEGSFNYAVFEYSKDKVSYRCMAPVDDVMTLLDKLFPEKKIHNSYSLVSSFVKSEDLQLKCLGEYFPESNQGTFKFLLRRRDKKEPGFLMATLRQIQNNINIGGTLELAIGNALSINVRADTQEKKLSVGVDNKTIIDFGRLGLVILPGNFVVSCKMGLFGNLFGKYKVRAHRKTDSLIEQINAHGVFSYHDELFSIIGKINDRMSYCLASCADGLRIKRAIIFDDKKNAELSFKGFGKKDEFCRGNIKMRFLANLLPNYAKNKLIGDLGRFELSFNQSEMPLRSQGTAEIVDSAFCVGGSTNTILSSKICFDVDLNLKAATLTECEIISSSGSIESKELLLNWGAQGLQYVHIPLKVKNFLVNQRKNFYAVVDGGCTFDWMDGGVHRIDGLFLIKKSTLNNVDADESSEPLFDFSTNALSDLNRSDFKRINGSIVVKTTDPLKVNLPALKTRAHIDGKVDIGMNNDGNLIPKISGSLKLDGGELEILGRPFRIVRGTVDVLSGQSDNPILNFLAYANIKQYRIAAHGSGSFHQPNLIFESTPYLSQEQIVGLMLSGAEHADINQQLPGIFLQNIHKILNSSDVAGKKNLIQSLINSFKYVQLLPYQDDLSSQKTVKARLHIELGPHLRALLHKDILGKEAVALQLEYDLSDELNFRFLRQSSGLVGAEAEMRFKF